MKRTTVLLLATTLPLVSLAGCAWLKSARPIMPVKEYERMLVGNLDADYIGNDNCLKACHEHDTIALYLSESVHGRQVEGVTGMPLVNCETCHGPGSIAVARAAEMKKCDTAAFVQIKDLPAGAQSLICLKCHSSYSMSNMQYWPISQHSQAGVSCSECHKLHAGPGQKLAGQETNRVCGSCHPAVLASFSLLSRHPLREGRMTCVTCHEPHGSMNESQLTAQDVKGLCLKCHASRTGPFVYEHGDVTDDCGNCHAPHGSPFTGLLKCQQPFLCLGCHTGHTEVDRATSPTSSFRQAAFTRCTNCHSRIHGSDTPGDTPRSRFLQ